jgi:hypothetical protein
MFPRFTVPLLCVHTLIQIGGEAIRGRAVAVRVWRALRDAANPRHNSSARGGPVGSAIGNRSRRAPKVPRISRVDCAYLLGAAKKLSLG